MVGLFFALMFAFFFIRDGLLGLSELKAAKTKLTNIKQMHISNLSTSEDYYKFLAEIPSYSKEISEIKLGQVVVALIGSNCHVCVFSKFHGMVEYLLDLDGRDAEGRRMFKLIAVSKLASKYVLHIPSAKIEYDPDIETNSASIIYRRDGDADHNGYEVYFNGLPCPSIYPVEGGSMVHAILKLEEEKIMNINLETGEVRRGAHWGKSVRSWKIFHEANYGEYSERLVLRSFGEKYFAESDIEILDWLSKNPNPKEGDVFHGVQGPIGLS